MMHTNNLFFKTWHCDQLDGYSKVYYARCNYEVMQYQDQFFCQQQLFFPPELARSVVKRKAEFFAGRYCARSALTMIDVTGITIETGGKRQPLWPVGIKGTISHTHLTAVCMVSASEGIKGIGVDQEFVLTDCLIDEISSQIINSEESHLIDQVNLSYAEAFTIAFSAKESFFKAMFPIYGEYFSFDAVMLIQLTVELDKGEFCLELNRYFCQEFCRGQHVRGYYLLQGSLVETYVVLS